MMNEMQTTATVNAIKASLAELSTAMEITSRTGESALHAVLHEAQVQLRIALYQAERVAELFETKGESDRCEHGMFFSGAGACPKCGGGAQ